MVCPRMQTDLAEGVDHTLAQLKFWTLQVAQTDIAKQIAKWDKARPAGVSKLDLTTVWGHTTTPLATLGESCYAHHIVRPCVPLMLSIVQQ